MACSSLYSALNKTPAQVHQEAVDKVTDYVELLIQKKIDESEDLTDEGKKKLKLEVAKLKADIIDKIAELKTKTDAAKIENSQSE